jgi:hypothetical protein
MHVTTVWTLPLKLINGLVLQDSFFSLKHRVSAANFSQERNAHFRHIVYKLS